MTERSRWWSNSVCPTFHSSNKKNLRTFQCHVKFPYWIAQSHGVRVELRTGNFVPYESRLQQETSAWTCSTINLASKKNCNGIFAGRWRPSESGCRFHCCSLLLTGTTNGVVISMAMPRSKHGMLRGMFSMMWILVIGWSWRIVVGPSSNMTLPSNNV